MTGPVDAHLPSEPTDEALVEQILAGRETPPGRSAATELFGRYQSRVYVWCLRLVRDHDRALDLSQDVLIGAYRALGSFQGRARFSSWLFAIMRNRCLSALRPVSLTRDEDVELETIADSAQGADRLLEEEEGRQEILALIRNVLTDEEQTAITLRCFERIPVDEITRILDIRSASGARGLLQTARRKLKAELARRERVEGGGAS